MEKITVVMVKADSPEIEVFEMNNTLEALQEAVEGYIEAVTVSDNMTMWVNEEGLLKDLPYNFTVIRQTYPTLSNIVGNVVVTRVTDAGDNASLTESDIEQIRQRFNTRTLFVI